jgi:PTS system nitrogen regulatory IIA component
MQLTVRDASKLLNALENSIYRWIRRDNLPAYRLQNQFRFNRAELLEWATSQQLEISPDIFKPAAEAGTAPLLSDALRAGGIFYRVEGTDTQSVLRAVVATMRLPEGIDREFLLGVFLARAPMESATIAEGIASPHVRHPVVLHVERPLVSLCFLEDPVEFGASDAKPVFAMFSLISPTVRAHLRLLSQLLFALRDAGFRAVLEQQGTREEILSQLRRIKTRLAEPAKPDEKAETTDL